MSTRARRCPPGTAPAAVELEVCAVQVSDDPFGIEKVFELPQVGGAGGLQRRQARRLRLPREVLHEAQVGEHVVDDLGTADRAVTGDQGPGAERAQHGLEHLDPAADRAHQRERGAAVEQQVAGEHHVTVGDEDDGIVRGMRRGADVADLAAQVAGPQGDAVGVGQERRGRLEVAPVHLGPDAGRRRHRGVEHGLAAPLVTDDGGAAHQVVAVRVIAVVVGVDQRPHRFFCDCPDGVQVGAGAPLGGGGVDADHAGVADQEAGVVEVPAAVRLQVGVDVLADSPDLAQAHCRAPSSRAAAAAIGPAATRTAPARPARTRCPR